MPTAYS